MTRSPCVWLIAIALYAALIWMPYLFDTPGPGGGSEPSLIFHFEDYGIELEYVVVDSMVFKIGPEDYP